MPNNDNGGPERDEHGCKIGEEHWSEEEQKCVPIEKTATDRSVDEVLADNVVLKKKVADQQSLIDELKEQLKAANDVLEAQTKAKLIGEIMPRSTFTVEDLAAKNLEELQNIRATLDQARYPTFKNIQLVGPIAADQQGDQGLTVGDLSIVTAEKRKASMERS